MIVPNRLQRNTELSVATDGANLLDGTQDTNAVGGTGGTLTVTSDAGDNFQINFEELASFDDFVTNRTYTITSDGDITTRVYMIGGGGGRSSVRRVHGGGQGGKHKVSQHFMLVRLIF